MKRLPIGTVVILKEAKKRIMIAGFLCNDQKQPEKMYDYCGLLYPEGYVGSDNFLLFNHSQIAKVFYLGLDDDENKKFQQDLDDFVESQKQDNNN